MNNKFLSRLLGFMLVGVGFGCMNVNVHAAARKLTATEQALLDLSARYTDRLDSQERCWLFWKCPVPGTISRVSQTLTDTLARERLTPAGTSITMGTEKLLTADSFIEKGKALQEYGKKAKAAEAQQLCLEKVKTDTQPVINFLNEENIEKLNKISTVVTTGGKLSDVQKDFAKSFLNQLEKPGKNLGTCLEAAGLRSTLSDFIAKGVISSPEDIEKWRKAVAPEWWELIPGLHPKLKTRIEELTKNIKNIDEQYKSPTTKEAQVALTKLKDDELKDLESSASVLSKLLTKKDRGLSPLTIDEEITMKAYADKIKNWSKSEKEIFGSLSKRTMGIFSDFTQLQELRKSIYPEWWEKIDLSSISENLGLRRYITCIDLRNEEINTLIKKLSKEADQATTREIRKITEKKLNCAELLKTHTDQLTAFIGDKFERLNNIAKSSTLPKTQEDQKISAEYVQLFEQRATFAECMVTADPTTYNDVDAVFSEYGHLLGSPSFLKKLTKKLIPAWWTSIQGLNPDDLDETLKKHLESLDNKSEIITKTTESLKKSIKDQQDALASLSSNPSANASAIDALEKTIKQHEGYVGCLKESQNKIEAETDFLKNKNVLKNINDALKGGTAAQTDAQDYIKRAMEREVEELVCVARRTGEAAKDVSSTTENLRIKISPTTIEKLTSVATEVEAAGLKSFVETLTKRAEELSKVSRGYEIAGKVDEQICAGKLRIILEDTAKYLQKNAAKLTDPEIQKELFGDHRQNASTTFGQCMLDIETAAGRLPKTFSLSEFLSLKAKDFEKVLESSDVLESERRRVSPTGWEKVKDLGSWTWSGISSGARGVWSFASDNRLANSVKEKISDVWSAVPGISSIENKFADAKNWLKGWTVDSRFARGASAMAGNVSEWVRNNFNDFIAKHPALMQHVQQYGPGVAASVITGALVYKISGYCTSRGKGFRAAIALVPALLMGLAMHMGKQEAIFCIPMVNRIYHAPPA